jgi:hypothetical protein
MRQEAGLIKGPKLAAQDGVALASEHLELGWEVEEQRIGYPRASSLYGACIRQHVLGTIHNKTKKEWEAARDRLLYGIGIAVQEWIQNRHDVLGDRRRGWWKCLACRRILYFGGPPKRRCQYCGAHPEAIAYHEHFMKLKAPWLVTGHPDMFLEKDPAVFRLLEIKTIKDDEFDKLKAPLIQHDWQIQTYMWGCELDEHLPVKTDSSIGYVMYVSKRYQTKELPYKMFTVQRSEALVQRIKEKVSMYTDGVRDFPENVPPPHDGCIRGGMDNYQAKSCPCRVECIAVGIGG